jgi:hypothetical protein
LGTVSFRFFIKRELHREHRANAQRARRGEL